MLNMDFVKQYGRSYLSLSYKLDFHSLQFRICPPLTFQLLKQDDEVLQGQTGEGEGLDHIVFDGRGMFKDFAQRNDVI